MTRTIGRALLGATLLVGAATLSVAPAMTSGWAQRVEGDVGIGNGRAGADYYGYGNGYRAHRHAYGYGYGADRGYGYGYPASGPVIDGDQGFDAY